MTADRRYLYVTVFVSGMTALAVEMSASRLLGNVFGSSNLVWASIIGLILIYLTAGYFLGGRWADRSPYPRTFYAILAWAGFSAALLPVIARPVLRLSAEAFDQLQIGVLAGSFVAVMILFIVPVTLMGTASPFAIRLLLRDPRHTGQVAGRISAISTLGSFVGTFLPVLLLIPAIGTYRTFMVIGGLLLLFAFIGLALTDKPRVALLYALMLVVVVVLAIVGLPGSDKATSGMVYEDESAYNYIQVLDQGGYMMLRLNDGQGVHSIYHPERLNYNGPWEQVLVAPYFNPAPYETSSVKSIAIIGLAAGTTARQATAVYGPIRIDGYEIDPQIIAVGRKYFDMTMPNLNAIAEDGRTGLRRSSERYTIISVDAYRPPYIPWHLTTREFFAEVKSHLADDGVLTINVGRGPTDRRLINALASTIASLFPSVYVVDLPNSFNSIVFATVQPSEARNLTDNLNHLIARADTSPLLLETLLVAQQNLQPGYKPAQVFTDDLSPIEWITNSLVLDFVFSGGVETLQ